MHVLRVLTFSLLLLILLSLIWLSKIDVNVSHKTNRGKPVDDKKDVGKDTATEAGAVNGSETGVTDKTKEKRLDVIDIGRGIITPIKEPPLHTLKTKEFYLKAQRSGEGQNAFIHVNDDADELTLTIVDTEENASRFTSTKGVLRYDGSPLRVPAIYTSQDPKITRGKDDTDHNILVLLRLQVGDDGFSSWFRIMVKNGVTEDGEKVQALLGDGFYLQNAGKVLLVTEKAVKAKFTTEFSNLIWSLGDSP